MKEGAGHTRAWHVPSDDGIERPGPIASVEVRRREAMGRRARGPRLRPIRRHTEVPQDPLHRIGEFNEREEPQPSATTGALEHVEPKRPSH